MSPHLYTQLPEQNLPRAYVCAVMSSERMMTERAVKRVHIDKEALLPLTLDDVRSELDSRADKICAGVNCRLIHYTGQECTVSGFHDKLGNMNKIPIATVATAWSDRMTGQGYVLIMNEVLYFGNDLDHSLINPNQIRHNGFEVFDNPYETDQARQMGIVLDEHNRIPFFSTGTTIYFRTHYPSDYEMEVLPHVVLTSDMPWEPSEIAMPGGSSATCTIQQVQSICHDHHRFETDCVTYSNFGETEQLMLKRAIYSVVVEDTRTLDALISELYSSA